MEQEIADLSSVFSSLKSTLNGEVDDSLRDAQGDIGALNNFESDAASKLASQTQIKLARQGRILGKHIGDLENFVNTLADLEGVGLNGTENDIRNKHTHTHTHTRH